MQGPGGEPDLRLLADRSDRGILPRAFHLEKGLTPPPQKPPQCKAHGAGEHVVAPEAPATPEPVFAHRFQRSSVGTARTPTGPPA